MGETFIEYLQNQLKREGEFEYRSIKELPSKWQVDVYTADGLLLFSKYSIQKNFAYGMEQSRFNSERNLYRMKKSVLESQTET